MSNNLALYATSPLHSRGRIYPEHEQPYRSPFSRDRDRIIHSSAFRRLEYKTQVFVNYEGDHYRTRLTHSLEVAQIARSIAKALNVSEDLAEALALAHDLGHPPFGHAGEDALNEAMKDFGGFDHNAHAIKILTKLEEKYFAFDGLNLTWETLEGIAKHNGPITNCTNYIAEFNKVFDLKLNQYSSIEAQISAIADDIAYNNHDIEDGLRANFFDMEALFNIPIIGDIFASTTRNNSDQPRSKIIYEAIRHITNKMVMDIINNTIFNIEKYHIKDAEDVRNLGFSLVHFSAEMSIACQMLKKFLYQNMYHHYKVNKVRNKTKRIIKELFEVYLGDPKSLPTKWQANITGPGTFATAQIVSDFVAGMTDRYAFKEYDEFFGTTL